MRVLWTVIILGALSGMPAYAQRATQDSVPSRVTLDDYIRLALEHNPQVRISASSLAGSVANRQSARARLLPQVGADAGASVSGSIDTGASSVPTASIGLNAQALLFDFGKTPAQYHSATKLALVATQDQLGAIQTVVLNARLAYYSALLASQVVSVNEEALRQSEVHLQQAKMLFEAGKQPRYAITKAEVDVANARVNVIRGRNSFRLALVQLETAAGMTFSDSLSLTDSLTAPVDSIGLAQALELTMRARPEMRSSQLSVDAARLQLAASQRSLLPAINGSAGLSVRRVDGNSGNPQWSVGMNVTQPIYEGGGIRASIAQARAGFAKAEASLDATKQTIAVEVEQHHLEEYEARQRIEATAVLVVQTAEGLALSQERYRAGAATSIEITDAELALANARIQQVQAYFDCHAAHAKLLRAMGESYQQGQ
jgi:outer membrane protein